VKKLIVVAILALFALTLVGVSFAQDEVVKCPMMEKCAGMGGMKGPCPMCCMKMKGMMEKEMVATEDGSVVVLAGNKLMKYDKDLELKKETQIKCDMKEACEKMCKECPCCQAMMKPEAKAAPVQAKTEPMVKKGKK